MTTRFDYINSSVEDLADFVEASPSQRISLNLAYHIKHGNTVVVDKIREARKVVKKRKLLRALEAL